MSSSERKPELRDALVPEILRVMADQRIGLRMLAERTGIAKSRLGTLLHRDTTRRARMTILETQAILDGLGIDVLEVLALAEGFAVRDPATLATYVPAVRMMCDMFRGMTTELIAALEQVEEMDGSEVRPEWAPALRKAVIKRVVQEIHAVARRRNIAYDFSLSS